MAHFGQKDAKFFYIILSNMKNKPDVDWAAVAEQSGFKNPKVAQTRFGQLKKKIEETNGGGDGHASVEKKKASPRKRKAAVKVESYNNDDTESERDQDETPSPPKRGRFGRLGKAKTMTEDFQTGMNLGNVENDELGLDYC